MPEKIETGHTITAVLNSRGSAQRPFARDIKPSGQAHGRERRS
jgi:hypothetical protein